MLDQMCSILVLYMRLCWFLVVGILGLDCSRGLVVQLFGRQMLALAYGSLSKKLLVPGVQRILTQLVRYPAGAILLLVKCFYRLPHGLGGIESDTP